MRVIQLASLLSILAMAETLPAGLIYGPISATSTVGNSNSGGTFDTAHLISQDGLTVNYTSGVTDSSAYTSNHNNSFDEWLSQIGTGFPGFVTFDMGQSLPLNGMLYWASNWKSSGNLDVKEFELLTDIDDDPTNGLGTALGTFNPAQSNNPHPMQTFSFTQTETRYVQMRILDDYGTNTRAGFSEAAFIAAASSTAVPEPSSFALASVLGMTAVASRYVRRRRRAKR